METVLGTINDIVWSMPLVILVLGAGIIFSFRMKFPQFRYLKEMFKIMASGKETEKGLSPLRAFVFTAARTVGVGNISGMAAAIFFGGPGAIFWLWVLALVGATVALIEAILAQTFRVIVNGEYRGGPAYYMEKGMKNKKVGRIFAIVYAVVTLVSIVLLMPGVQSYNISHGISDAFGVPVIAVGVLFAALIAFTIFGGLKRIGTAAQRISPIMATLYVLMSIVIIIVNIQSLPQVFSMIIGSAFGADQVFGALLGTAITWGIKRGVFANEVGIGTSAITGAVGEVSHPVKQGLTNALSVFVGTFLVCTPSAIMMLMTGCYNVSDGAGGLLYEGLAGVSYGNGFVSAAIDTIFMGIGKPFVAIAILCFAFVALLAYYLYAETNMFYLFPAKKPAIFTLRICFVASVFIGSILSADTIWTLGDIGNGAMAWVNVIALIILGGLGIKIFKDYDKQKKAGIAEPEFDAKALGIENVSECWSAEATKVTNPDASHAELHTKVEEKK